MSVDVEIQALRAEYASKLRELVEKHVTALVHQNLSLTHAPPVAVHPAGRRAVPAKPAPQAAQVTKETGKATCSHKDCTKPVLAKKLCRNHYQQMRNKVRAAKAKAEAAATPQPVPNGATAPAPF